MSTFNCEKCNITCWDTETGYITGCTHYPPDYTAVNLMFKNYQRSQALLQQVLDVCGKCTPPNEMSPIIAEIERFFKERSI